MSKLFFNDNNNNNNSTLFESWSFDSLNYVFFGLGLIFIVLGYLVMATGAVNSFQSLTIAPVMLFIGYIILIPLSLIYRSDIVKNK